MNNVPDTIYADGAVISVTSTVKTLGTWISHDLFSKINIAENVARHARRTYFVFALGNLEPTQVVSIHYPLFAHVSCSAASSDWEQG